MSWASELPDELLQQPMGLVYLTGLDIMYNAIHKSIWDCFCNNRRSDRVSLRFKVIGFDHEYPKCRSKRTSYDWYIPKGILKTGWMKKHLEQIPSVVVIFFDLDWDENQWKEKQMECATKVQIIRDGLGTRSMKVAVVLIQKTSPLPPGEDVVAAERAASLCAACELSAKSLFVLPHTDHLLGYTIRLENAFFELSQAYYQSEARKVKNHKELLNKTTHQLLFVRHQFKIAFFFELKLDTPLALKHYKQAYGHVLELRMHDTNLLEVKTIAGFINYKICRLSFQHNVPLEAIAQFRKHIDFFKNKNGIQDLEFEHSAWMSKQFQIFSDLFDEAIKLGLTAIQTQHPGFYYQQAANHSQARKQHCLSLCKPNIVPLSTDPLENLQNLDYYGQRPWRQGHQSIDPPDAMKEKNGILALQFMELTVDHSRIIIPQLNHAVAQFKKYKSPRMKRFLMVQMGEEYYHSKDYNKALTLLSRVTWDYRMEHWWSLLTNILMTSLRCAYLTASIQEYVTICIELIGKYTLCVGNERERIHNNLIRILSNNSPEPEPGCHSECTDKALITWEKLITSPDIKIITVDMQNIIPFIECKACFTSSSFTADEYVILKVFLLSSALQPISINKLAVGINNPIYNDFCVVTNDTKEKSILIPGEIKCHTFSFLSLSSDVDKNLEISSIDLELGNGSSMCVYLHWIGGGGDAVATSNAQQMSCRPHPLKLVEKDLAWHEIEVRLNTTHINSRISNVNISLIYEAPCLVNEVFVFKTVIKNEELSDISDVRISFGLVEGQDSFVEPNTFVDWETTDFSSGSSKMMHVKLENMLPQEEIEKCIYVKCNKIGDRNLFFKLEYSVEVNIDEEKISCNCYKEETLLLPCMNPLKVSFRLANMQFQDIESIHLDEPFILLTEISSSSPWSLDIQKSTLELDPYLNHNDTWVSQVENIHLKSNDSLSECLCLISSHQTQQNVPMGNYMIHWKRDSLDYDLPFVSTCISLPLVNIIHMPLFVEVVMPAFGNVRSNLPVVYNIHNRTPYSQEIEISMETSDAFMFAGHKHTRFRILPHTYYQLKYAMYPLMPGNVLLPKLRLNMLRFPGGMEQVIQSSIPSHVYIKPSQKQNGYISNPLVDTENTLMSMVVK